MSVILKVKGASQFVYSNGQWIGSDRIQLTVGQTILVDAEIELVVDGAQNVVLEKGAVYELLEGGIFEQVNFQQEQHNNGSVPLIYNYYGESIDIRLVSDDSDSHDINDAE